MLQSVKLLILRRCQKVSQRLLCGLRGSVAGLWLYFEGESPCPCYYPVTKRETENNKLSPAQDWWYPRYRVIRDWHMNISSRSSWHSSHNLNLTVAALWLCHLNTNTWLNLNFKSQGYKVVTNYRWERLLSPQCTGRVICTICCRIPWLADNKVPVSGVFQPHTGRPFCRDYRHCFTNARAINKLSALLCQHL